MAWCDDCNAGIEWHVTKAGRRMPIDPLPRPDGDYYFDNALTLCHVVPGSDDKTQRDRVQRGRLFVSHFDTCLKRRAREPREPLACFRCGSTDHLVAECPEDE